MGVRSRLGLGVGFDLGTDVAVEDAIGSRRSAVVGDGIGAGEIVPAEQPAISSVAPTANPARNERERESMSERMEREAIDTSQLVGPGLGSDEYRHKGGYLLQRNVVGGSRDP